MSDSSDSPLILPSVGELKKAEADRELNTKSSNDSENELDNSQEINKSPSKLQRSAIHMTLDETDKELKYRRKHFKDENEVITSRKLRCTRCCTNLQSLVLEGRDIYHHPVLKVLMCKDCIHFYGDGNFSIDEDGSDKYCRWCGQGGTLYCCGACTCAFCKTCIKRNLNRSILDDIESDDWKCFICDGQPLWELRAVCANAQSFSRKIRRSKREVQSRSLKKLQKKRNSPLKRRSSRLQHHSDSSSSSEDEEEIKKNKSRAILEKRKKKNFNSAEQRKNKKQKQSSNDSCDSSSKNGEKKQNKNVEPVTLPESDRDSSPLPNKKRLRKNVSKSMKNSKSRKSDSTSDENSRTSGDNSESSDSCDMDKKKSKLQSKKKVNKKPKINERKCNKKSPQTSEDSSSDDIEGKHLPEEVDPESAKVAHDFLKDHLSEIVDVGKLLAYRAERLLEKKIDVGAMSNPERVREVIDNMKLLVKLAGENMGHTKGFLTRHHKYWKKRVIKRNRKSKIGGKNRKSTEKDIAEHDKSESRNSDKDIVQDIKEKKNKGSDGKEDLEEDKKRPVNGLSEDENVDLAMDIENDISMENEDITNDANAENEDAPKQQGSVLPVGSDKAEDQAENEKDVETSDNETHLTGMTELEVNREEDLPLENTKKRKLTDNVDKESDVNEAPVVQKHKRRKTKDTENDITVTDQKVTDTTEFSKKNKKLTSDLDNISETDKLEDVSDIEENSPLLSTVKESDIEKLDEDSNCNKNTEKEDGNFENLSKTADTLSEFSLQSVSTILAPIETDNIIKDNLNLNNSENLSKSYEDLTLQLANDESSDTNEEKNSNVIKDEKENLDKRDGTKLVKESDNEQNAGVDSDCGTIEFLSDNSSDDGQKLESCDTRKDSPGNMKQSKEKDSERNKKNQKDMDTTKEEFSDNKNKTESSNEESGDITVDMFEGLSDKDNDNDISKKEEDNEINQKEDLECNSETIQAKEALLGYTTDDDDDKEEEDLRRQKRLRKKKGRSKKETTDTKEKSNKRLRKPGPKSRTYQNDTLSSSPSSESDSNSSTNNSDCHSASKQQQKKDGEKKKKFKLKNTEAYKKDEKLSWKCTVEVECLPEEEFQKYYERYYSSDEDGLQKKLKDVKEIKSLVNLKTLKKGSGKTKVSDEEDSEDSVDDKKKRKKKSKKDKETEQKLIDFFNKSDDDAGEDKNMNSGESDSEKEEMKDLKIEKDFLDKKNEMAMKLLIESSCDDSEEDNNEEPNKEEEKEKKKAKNKPNKEEVEEDNEKEMQENDEIEMQENDEKEKKGDNKKEMEEDSEKEKDENVKEMDEDEKEKDKDSEKEKDEDSEKEKDEDNEKEKVEDNVKDKDEDNQKEKDEDNQKEKNVDSEKEKDEESEKESKKEKIKDSEMKDDPSEDSDTPAKKNWRKDKLLTEKLIDVDTSDEERLWKARKKRQMEANEMKKKAKRRILGSDDDDDNESVFSISSSESSDDDFVTKKSKKRSKKSKATDNSSDSGAPNAKKSKRKRIKAPASDSSSDEDGAHNSSQKSGDTPGKGRKNIHKIMKDDNVTEATRRAAREEEDRKKRIADKQKLYNTIFNEIEGVEKLDSLVLDFDPETKKELVSVNPFLVSKLKPHQVSGVKFMWDACFESLKQIGKTTGTGCILAHCMGLGKTFQIVTLVHTLLTHKKTRVNTVLIVCPLSTVLNWVSEFNMWLKDIEDEDEINIYELSKYKKNYERMYQLQDWQESGGVMVMGYDMYRILANPQNKRGKKKTLEAFQSTLVDPGPDLIVCDEGHLLKNEDTALAKSMHRIKTLRRIVLTGTPLQNNLKEYHCMVQFVKPNLLGTRKEFLNRFVNPISNGQFEDSTSHDVKIMKRRAHVLHKMLEGCVQRKDYSVLMPFLPPKYEYVISIRLSEMQIKTYRHYLDFYSMGRNNKDSSTKGARLFNDFQNLQRIWTHPKVLKMSSEKAEKCAEKKRFMESDSEGSLRDFIDDDDDDDSTSENTSSHNSSSDDSDVQILSDEEKKKKKKKAYKHKRTTRSMGIQEEPEEEEKDTEGKEEEKDNSFDWWKQFVQDDDLESIQSSGKLVLLFSILRECEKIGDKVLVFSQSLFSLDLIEHFLNSIDNATQNSENSEALNNNTGSWSLGLDYFRLDGSTKTENRNLWCKAFNREDNHRARLFIISTRAGGLGINLFSANRVIIFDASWNPSHDVQSIFRVYRFGQKKPCYIYRFLAQGTMEEKIYDRQVTKLSLSCRVIDEQQIERHYNMADLQELYQFDPEQKTKRPTPILPKDRLLAELLKEHEQWIVTYHEHDSLLENKEEEELNEEERKTAWEEYENEKKGKVVTQALPNQMPMMPATLNVAALRESLKKENPLATPEQIEQKLRVVMSQIYEYLTSKNGQATYNTMHMQALQQFQQEQQFARARQEAGGIGGYNLNAAIQQQFANPEQMFTPYNPPPKMYPTNLYRNVSGDKSNVLRMESKLMPANVPGSSGVMNFNPLDRMAYYMNQPQSSWQQGYPQVQQLQNQSRATSQMQNLLMLAQNAATKKPPVPDDVVETID